MGSCIVTFVATVVATRHDFSVNYQHGTNGHFVLLVSLFCLCASVYTQLSDVEDETNGIVTYDRKVVKVEKDRMKKINERMIIQ